MKGQKVSGGSGGKGAGKGAGKGPGGAEGNSGNGRGSNGSSDSAKGPGTHSARPSAKWGNGQAAPPHGQFEWGRPFKDGTIRGGDSILTLSNTHPTARALGAEDVTEAKGLTLRLVLGSGHSVTSPDILLQVVEQVLRYLMVTHSLVEFTLPLADGWIRRIRDDPYWSRSAKERAASFPTFCSVGSSPGAWEVVPDIPPPLILFAACSVKSIPLYSDIWTKVLAHPPRLHQPRLQKALTDNSEFSISA
jgi:hypothetical protein